LINKIKRLDEEDITFFLTRLLIFIIAWIFFVVVDPLGFDSATRTSSSNFLQTIFQPFYGLNANPAQQKIAVVAITDSTLKNINHQQASAAANLHESYHTHALWPLPYSDIVGILDSIIQAKPRAIFVDIRFTGNRRRDSLNQFDSFLIYAKNNGIPVLFANGLRRDGYGPLPPPLTHRSATAEWNAGSNLYALQVADCSVGTTCDQGVGRQHMIVRDSAAFAMYRLVCKHGFQPYCSHAVNPSRFTADMALRWGTLLSPQQRLIAGPRAITDCQTFGPQPWSRFLQSLENAGRSLTHLIPRQRCPYELTIDAAQLNQATWGTRNHPSVNIDSLLHGRVVFLGADLRAEHDVVRVPGVGLLAGVQEQAMAFDNLLSFGNQYFHKPGDMFHANMVSISDSVVTEAIIWLVLSIDYLFVKMNFMQDEKKAKWAERPSYMQKIMKKHNEYRQSKILRAGIPSLMALFMTLIFIDDVYGRNLIESKTSVSTILEYFIVYVLIYIIFIVSFYQQTAFAKNFVLRPLMLLPVIIPVLFINEFYLHWQNNDWIALVLLWALLPDIAESILQNRESENDKASERETEAEAEAEKQVS
jgi:hypothetical protein